MFENFLFQNKTIIIMGGGTTGWISALYFLNKLKDLNLNLKIKLISSNQIEPIGVGEGTTPIFTNFIENICKIDKKEFLKETKGSFKYGIKFDNWNFDNEYYYHLFNYNNDHENIFQLIQYYINENLPIKQKELQKKLCKKSFDLLENDKISLNINNTYAYHFSADLIISFLKKKCLEFKDFEHIEGTINDISYDKNGFIESLLINEFYKITGDFFVNCLGFKSTQLLNHEYFNIQNWDNYILNNSAFAIQVKNSELDSIEPYTTSTAQEYGWCWKIPQYEKTGYGYVYSSDFIDDEDKLYNDLLRTYNIKEKDVFKTKVVKSKPYFNKKQLHKNCLSLGLASGFVEPLEATSIHMTLKGLDIFFELVDLKMIQNQNDLNGKFVDVFNDVLEKDWRNIFKFIIFHYITNNPINDYWKHYKNIQENNIFDFYEKYFYISIFSNYSYFMVSLGLKIKDYYYSFSKQNTLKKNINNYLNYNNQNNNQNLNLKKFYSHKQILDEINYKEFDKINLQILKEIDTHQKILYQ